MYLEKINYTHRSINGQRLRHELVLSYQKLASQGMFLGNIFIFIKFNHSYENQLIVCYMLLAVVGGGTVRTMWIRKTEILFRVPKLPQDVPDSKHKTSSTGHF